VFSSRPPNPLIPHPWVVPPLRRPIPFTLLPDCFCNLTVLCVFCAPLSLSQKQFTVLLNFYHISSIVAPHSVGLRLGLILQGGMKVLARLSARQLTMSDNSRSSSLFYLVVRLEQVPDDVDRPFCGRSHVPALSPY